MDSTQHLSRIWPSIDPRGRSAEPTIAVGFDKRSYRDHLYCLLNADPVRGFLTQRTILRKSRPKLGGDAPDGWTRSYLDKGNGTVGRAEANSEREQ